MKSQSQNNSLPPSTLVKTQQKPLETYIEQDWQRVDTKGLDDDLDWAAAEGDDLEEWECVACRKTFRSEAAWNSHERSKKHMKEVEGLKREMQTDDQDLDLDGENEDKVTYISDQLLARNSSSSINLVAEASTSFPSLHPQFMNDSEISEEKDLKVSHEESRAKTNKIAEGSHTSISETENTKASKEDDSSPADPPILQEMSKRDQRRARQAKKGELEGNNNLSVWMTTFCSLF